MAVEIPFNRDFEVEYGKVDGLSPLIRRVVADNPSPFTFKGTGTYIVGRGKVAVIDPGPAIDAHIAAILKAVAGEEVTHILITHTHLDHSPGAAPLKAATGAETYGYGPHGAAAGEPVEEGGDMAFRPDIEIRHGDLIPGGPDDGRWTMECVYTPGHTSNHMCFALREEKVLFTGDHVMGWATSVISPPDGDMAAYMASLALLLERDDALYWPTHGPAIRNPKPYVRAFIAHREEREAQILAQIRAGHGRIADMVPEIYKGYPRYMYGAAGRSVFAHIEHMAEKGLIATDGPVTPDAVYRIR